ncbi:MarR family winged helix-turn-helix transcriptional regulator [Paramicrobacterium fandaimingii]|uniref:MarR family winged helix-turn-helix transcriptional regulator n=1 Tax=Paramicrobacterium fandaimingii TaxID=2708079 RepID=UPI00141F7861|nr:MarR family transcriptional regulator [Microbacterium fandaimingii]
MAPPAVNGNAPLRYFTADPTLVDQRGLSPDEVEQCLDVMNALRVWREADRLLSEVLRRYMKLNDTDMRAVRFLMHMQDAGRPATPKDIAREVAISSASTTKLVDRLVAGGHVTRVPHPTDRRTMCIDVTDATRTAARETVGHQHARRFTVAAKMDATERATVVRFLTALAEADVPTGKLAVRATGNA